MEKSFWNHLGLLLKAVIGVGFLLTCVGLAVFFFNHEDSLVCMFGTIGYVIIVGDNFSQVVDHVYKYFAYQKWV
jgi:hypothetical protein